MTNLSDFLKVKQVRCVNNGGLGHLTEGKEYEIKSIDYISVSDNDGDSVCVDTDWFEPVLESAETPLQGMELTPEFEAVEPVLVDNCQVNIQDIGTDILDTNADIKDTPKFKVGDRVYTGLTGKIETVEYFDIRENEMITQADEVFNAKKCCHATQENYERLQATFPDIEFEQPPKELKGSEATKQILKENPRQICYVGDQSDFKCRSNDITEIAVVVAYNPNTNVFVTDAGEEYCYAVPVDGNDNSIEIKI